MLLRRLMRGLWRRSPQFHVYAGAGSGLDGHALFQIVGSQLRAKVALDFETKPVCSIRVRSADQGNLWIEKVFTIMVQNVEEAPTDILPSGQGIPENEPAGAVVGVLSTIDPDGQAAFAYDLVAGAGSTHIALFQIVSDELRAVESFNFEVRNGHSIRIRSTDQAGLSLEKVFTIGVMNVNEAPTGVWISSTGVLENQPAGSLVGILFAADPDAGGSFTYALAEGEGSADNGWFHVAGGQLRTNASFDHEVRSSYSIRVRSTDQGGLWVEQVLPITIIDITVEDSSPPTARLHKPIKPKAGKLPLRFAVMHSDDVAVSIASIGDGDIVVTGPRRYKRYAKLFKKGSALDAAAILATYQITAPGGVWDAADNGVYTLWLCAGRTSDASGKICAKTKLGTFKVALAKAKTSAARPMAAQARAAALSTWPTPARSIFNTEQPIGWEHDEELLN